MSEATELKLQLLEEMEQRLQILKRAISARESRKGAVKHYRAQAFMNKQNSRADSMILRDYETAVYTAAQEFIKTYERYEKYADGEPVEKDNLFGAA